MVQLPKYIALKSKYNNDYLRLVNEASAIQSFLQYSGDRVLTPFTKYEVEQAKLDPSLVHIRSCYNNKYWASSRSNSVYVAAEAEEIEEDKSKWNCTLFKPEYDTTHKAFRFLHVHRGFNVCLWRGDAPFTNCLTTRWSDPDKDLCDLSTVIDWGTLIPLPKYVAFKGDNEHYLRSRWAKRNPFLQFSANEIGDSTVGMETFITRDGEIRVYSIYFGKFWRRSNDWIWADSTDSTTNNPDTLFWPTQVDANVIALRNLGNDHFVKRLTADGFTSCLGATGTIIDSVARLEIYETVKSREIFNVRFRLAHSRIYDKKVLTLATQRANNPTQGSKTMNLKLTYTDTTSRTWESSASMKLGVTTTITTGVPLIAQGSIEISTQFSGLYNWGEMITTSKEIESAYEVTVPPMTTMIVRLVATRGTCDVPFSYTQRDKLLNGEVKSYEMDDGVYHGTNSYNFTYETESTPLSI